jgi:hypothetical protein
MGGLVVREVGYVIRSLRYDQGVGVAISSQRASQTESRQDFDAAQSPMRQAGAAFRQKMQFIRK